jgi:GxxExxY protein
VELTLRGIPFQRQVEIEIVYKGHVIRGQRIDLVVAGEVVVELKAVNTLPEVATAQVLSYVKAAKLKRGLLINFNCKRLVDGIKRLSM